MTVVKVSTVEELNNALATYDSVVVDFSAPGWCVPCRRLAPHFAGAAEKLPEILFVEVDIDQSPDLRVAYDIMSVPYLVRFDRGQLVGEVKGRTTLQLTTELSA